MLEYQPVNKAIKSSQKIPRKTAEEIITIRKTNKIVRGKIFFFRLYFISLPDTDCV